MQIDVMGRLGVPRDGIAHPRSGQQHCRRSRRRCSALHDARELAARDRRHVEAAHAPRPAGDEPPAESRRRTASIVRASRFDRSDVDRWWTNRSTLRFTLFETQRLLGILDWRCGLGASCLVPRARAVPKGWRKRLGVEPSLPRKEAATDFEDREGHRAPFTSGPILSQAHVPFGTGHAGTRHEARGARPRHEARSIREGTRHLKQQRQHALRIRQIRQHLVGAGVSAAARPSSRRSRPRSIARPRRARTRCRAGVSPIDDDPLDRLWRNVVGLGARGARSAPARCDPPRRR